MKQRDKNRQNPLGKVIGAIVVLAVMNPAILAFLLVIGIPVGLCWLLYRAFRNQKPASESHRAPARQNPLDDRPKPICFHRDKGIHHVIRGRGQDPWDNLKQETDPWDRPDIDIRKYQHR